MNKDKQRIAIAEACGWTQIGAGMRDWGTDASGFRGRIPDYLNDLNAMDDALSVLSNDQLFRMAVHLKEIVNGDEDWPSCDEEFWAFACYATAAQRAEAFLKTIKKWEESE